MNKLLAVVKREYIQRVRNRMFILITVLGPVVISLFGIAPALIFSINAGGPIKVAVVDQTGKVYPHIYNAIMEDAVQPVATTESVDRQLPDTNANDRFEQLGDAREESFELEEIHTDGRPLDEVKNELNGRVRAKELDGYLILPANMLNDGKAEFFGRSAGNVFSKRFLQKALSKAIREERLIEAHIDSSTVQRLSMPAQLEATKIGVAGGERDSGEGFVLVFGVGFVMYLTILLYGQVILGAVIEEKETRIAEILFSSVKPFTLMMGKLVGVSLVALTQLAIWGLAFGAFALYGVGVLAHKGVPIHIPHIPAINVVYFALFFLLGYFIYSTLYALIGSMVTTAQEGGQLAMPIVLLLVVGFYMFLPVSRSPDSSFAFWISMFPFFSPITMLVRIVAQSPPFWEIALSLIVGFGTVVMITLLTSRIYRVGMLMYGKKATIPEVMRWVRLS
ncbi:MAG TPA: hypothetical protein DCK93_06285 [Blastocatellia bacterium]|jgi:ABC-2 type transport system permease protein|nr:hypothetical protein [Blastocatellia bacterium]HAF22510.1 hypothetical protein [Blastocatellia bacterium]